MRKTKIIEGCYCLKCEKAENQLKKGFNKSGTQKMFCKECGSNCTLEPKRHEYPEETQKLALKIYYSGVNADLRH